MSFFLYYEAIMKQFDIIVVGSGGGSKITRPAANLGLNVAVIEKDQLGGTCLNRGCIPSKMLIHPADVIREIQDAKRFGITLNDSFVFDSQTFVTDVVEEIKHESDSIKPLYDAHKNITYFHDQAHFVDDYVLKVGDEFITATKIFLAVGTRPYIPPIKGLSDTSFWTSTEALSAITLPKSLVILGGGYIACELGHYFSAMGVDVTFLLRSEFIKSHDDDIKEEFNRVFGSYCRVYNRATVNQIVQQESQFHIDFLDKDDVSQSLVADQVLVATGIVPNSDTLNLASTSIICDESGFIAVNDCLETSLSGVYAFGDVIGRHFFRHTANFEGQYLFDTVIKHQLQQPISYRPVPYAMFTHPQVAGVGVTEAECIKKGIDFVVGKNSYKDSAMGMALRSEYGFVKLIFERVSTRLIGAHIIGREASTLIHMLIAFMNMNAGYDDVVETIYIHPALSEIIRNAARNCDFQ